MCLCFDARIERILNTPTLYVWRAHQRLRVKPACRKVQLMYPLLLQTLRPVPATPALALQAPAC